MLKSRVRKRSIVVAGHKTSLSLDDGFYKGLKDMAREKKLCLGELVALIDSEGEIGYLSCRVRLAVLAFYQNKVAEKNAAASGVWL